MGTASARSRESQGTSARPSTGSVLVGLATGLGPLHLIVVGLTISVAVWAWFAMIIGSGPDWDTFGWTFFLTSVAGGLLQIIAVFWIDGTGSLRERLTVRVAEGPRGVPLLLLVPAVVYAIVFFASARPDIPADGFEYGWSVYQAIGVLLMLSVVGAALGGGVAFIIMVPIGILVAAVLPRTQAERDGTSRSTAFGTMTPLNLVAGVAILAGAVSFAIAMQFVLAAGSGSTRADMARQFVALVSLRGGLLPTIWALASIALIVVGAVVSNREQDAGLRRAARAVSGPAAPRSGSGSHPHR
ncbi:hypothetical protein [Pseudolysinimonas kribbensis]|uniref:Uncharacterized protein n=1 Tax=Pseudolysinimonas kribbensis TaxID=433641 RepID=A0ABQ6K7R8_9MICO|nr:hypothetical protein [Pseudolysinimonas kribbensis]GMA94791.1 hypothetical protein GCM10025881_16150 [Pseudolysinimonas kribbensis]